MRLLLKFNSDEKQLTRLFISVFASDCTQWRGNNFRTGGARPRAPSQEREIKYFAEIGVLFIPKTSVL